MQVQLREPLSRLRDSAVEVGKIVLGVLIALAANQMADANHWRHIVVAEKKVLDDDVAQMWDSMSGRVRIQKCVDNRLDELALIFARHERGLPLKIVAPIGRPGVWIPDTNAFQIAIADQSLSHMPLEQKSAYFEVASTYATFAPVAEEERASWRALEALNEASALDSTDWRELRSAYRDAVDTNRVMKAQLVFGGHDGRGWLTPFEEFPKMPTNDETPWMIKELCSSAVKR